MARGDLDLPADAESVAILRKNVVVLWSVGAVPAKGAKKPPAPKIKELGDLVGHRVGVIGRTQANVKLLRVILTESGVNADKVTITQFGVTQLAEMAKDTAIDAYMAVGPLNSKITIEAIALTAKARGEPKFLPIDVSETIAQRHPLYEAEEIPGSTFTSSPARPEDKIDTISVNHLIVAPKSLSETAVGGFVRQLFTVRQSLAREVPGAAKIEKPDTDKDAALPAHAGAAAYIDGNERTFLEKYSDYIWGIILVLSGLGSAGAWLRHYLQRDEREQYDQHRDDMLDDDFQGARGGDAGRPAGDATAGRRHPARNARLLRRRHHRGRRSVGDWPGVRPVQSCHRRPPPRHWAGRPRRRAGAHVGRCPDPAAASVRSGALRRSGYKR